MQEEGLDAQLRSPLQPMGIGPLAHISPRIPGLPDLHGSGGPQCVLEGIQIKGCLPVRSRQPERRNRDPLVIFPLPHNCPTSPVLEAKSRPRVHPETQDPKGRLPEGLELPIQALGRPAKGHGQLAPMAIGSLAQQAGQLPRRVVLDPGKGSESCDQ